MGEAGCANDYQRIAYTCCLPSAILPARYDFVYRLLDFEFEQVDVTTLSVEKVATDVDGLIKNCVVGTMVIHMVDMSFVSSNTVHDFVKKLHLE